MPDGGAVLLGVAVGYHWVSLDLLVGISTEIVLDYHWIAVQHYWGWLLSAVG